MRFLSLLCLTLAAPLCGLAAGDPADAFYQAIRNDDLGALKTMLSQGADVNAKDKRDTTPLMYAAAFGSVDAMKILIAKGAHVNARNAFAATALMWAAYDLNKVRLLIDKGADVNARSKQGRTPLIIAATYPGNVAVVRLLHQKGAEVNARDEDKATPLLAAVDLPIAKLLVEKGAEINVKSAAGTTPLMNAVGGRGSTWDVAWAKMLLAKGADVHAVSEAGQTLRVKNGPIEIGSLTPLLVSAAYGPPEMVQMLLDAGSDVNARDVRGMTPLMLAIGSDHNDPQVVKLLLARGADPKIRSKAGEDAFDWARKFQDVEVLHALGMKPENARSGFVQPAGARKTDAGKAVQASMNLLVKSASQFLVEGGCVSCHAQNMAGMAAAAVRGTGITIDEAAVDQQVKATLFGFGGFEQPMLQRVDPPGASDTVMYSLLSLHASKHPADRVTDAMVFDIAGQQHATGEWDFGGIARPPIEDGSFSRTALCMRTLQVYGFAGRKSEFDDRIARAARWLLQAKPHTTEDANMRLLGLKWSKAASKTVESAVREVLALQREDGGWAQTRYLGSDAYATGQALYALRTAGLPVSDPAYQRGVEWLLKTQLPDGSWHVASRAPKFQPYFQSGFPHDHDQWISSMATGWAVMGLSPVLAPAAVAQAAAR